MIRELRILFKLFPCIKFVVDAKLCWKLEHFVRAKETVYRKLPRITNEPWIYWWRTVCHETALNIIKIQKKRLTKVTLFNRSQFSLVQATGCAYSSSIVLLLGKTESNSSTSGCTVVVPMFEHLGHAQSPPRKGGIDTRHSLRYLW